MCVCVTSVMASYQTEDVRRLPGGPPTVRLDEWFTESTRHVKGDKWVFVSPVLKGFSTEKRGKRNTWLLVVRRLLMVNTSFHIFQCFFLIFSTGLNSHLNFIRVCILWINALSFLQKKRFNTIVFSPLCPQNNTFSVFTHTSSRCHWKLRHRKLLPFVFTFGSPLFFSLTGFGKTMRCSKS